MGELFLAERLFDMGYLFFFRVCSVCSGYAQSYLEKTNEVLTLEKKKTVQVKPKTKPEVSVKEGTKSKL